MARIHHELFHLLGRLQQKPRRDITICGDEQATTSVAQPDAYSATRATFWNGRVTMLYRDRGDFVDVESDEPKELTWTFIMAAVLAVALALAIVFVV
jgi:hypothetical protein